MESSCSSVERGLSKGVAGVKFRRLRPDRRPGELGKDSIETNGMGRDHSGPGGIK